MKNYAKLVIGIFNLPKLSESEFDRLVGNISSEHRGFIAALDQAIAGLVYVPNAGRLQRIICLYYGIGCDPLSLRQVGQELPEKINADRVSHLRGRALRIMLRNPLLDALALQLCNANFLSPDLVKRVVEAEKKRLADAQAAQVETAVKEAVAAAEHVSRPVFLLECDGGCDHESPCASCRANALLEQHDIRQSIHDLAHEWQTDSDNPLDWEPISNLGEMSVRTANCLQNDNIITVGQLVKRTESEMLRTPNFGRKSLNELKDLLRPRGLRFGMK